MGRAIIREIIVVGCLVGCGDPEAADVERFIPEDIGELRMPAGDRASPCAVAAGETGVYWTDRGDGSSGSGSVMHLAAGAETPIVLASGQDSPCALAVDPDGVSWATYRPVHAGNLFRIEHTGDDAFSLAADIDVVRALAVAAGRLYWANAIEGTVNSLGLEDGSLSLVAIDEWDVAAMAATGSAIFWATRSDIVRVDLRSKAPTVWADVDPAAFAATADELVWITRLGAVMRAVEDGVAVLAPASNAEGAHAIALDAERVYFTDAVEGSVRSVPLSGGEATTLAICQGQPTALAVDASNVYWIDAERGGIHMAPKGGQTR